jgi:hypothetical protein
MDRDLAVQDRIPTRRKADHSSNTVPQNKKSPGENQWPQDPHETREIESAEVFGSMDFTCDLKNWGRPPRAPVWIGLLEDKNSVVFGPAESLRGLLIGRGRWWRGEDDEEATEKESDPRSNCQRSFHGARHYCPCHPLALKPWQALSCDGSITLAF